MAKFGTESLDAASASEAQLIVAWRALRQRRNRSKKHNSALEAEMARIGAELDRRVDATLADRFGL